MTNSKKFAQIDVLYSIGTLLVVLGHSHYSDWSAIFGNPYEKTLIFVYLFHMPLFFFIAGFLFINSNKLERVGYGKWIGEKATKLLTPYVILSIVAIIPKFYLENHSFSGFTPYLAKAILVPREGVWGHFWFLPVIFLIYALFGLWKKYLYSVSPKVVLSITFITSIALYFMPFKTEWLGISDLTKDIFFFVTGCIFYLIIDNTNVNLSKVFYLIIGVVLLLASVMVYHYFKTNSVIKMIDTIVVIMACWCISCFAGDTKITKWISAHNFTIYIYSWLFQSVVMMICEKFGMPWYFAAIAMFISGLGFPVIIAVVYEKWTKIHNKFFDLLLGVK